MLTAIVSVETVLLVLLVVLVAALLRSHAEILRRLGPDGAARPLAEPRVAPSRAGGSAPALSGVTPTGDAVRLAFDGRSSTPTLLAFLSTGCTSCAQFFDTLGQRRPAGVLQPAAGLAPGDGLETVIVTRGADREQRVKLRSLAPPGVPVLMSSEAWQDYSVPGSPYFVLVDGGAVVGEGVATTWQALNSLVTDAIDEQRETDGAGERHGRIDERLATAGVGPDHPSLYPGREG